MTYRTKRPRTRHILTFGVGATLAITQLGAGCVPAGELGPCDSDASSSNCSSPARDASPEASDAATEGGDAK
ncbi:MAG: hypothetical protein JNL38_16295 [Myxococcales bacterium]|jgi:hypothetical protein|nr:hypothetical protein [Myxococcales bacterium]